MNIELNDLLAKIGVEPKETLVMRHRPSQPKLRRLLGWLAADRPEVFNAYQQTQGPRAEKALAKATYLVSLIGSEAGKAVFVGLFHRADRKPLTFQQYRNIPAFRELWDSRLLDFEPEKQTRLWFELDLTSHYSDWAGRLIFCWPGGERSWWRWADRNQIPIHAIDETNNLDAEMPAWEVLTLDWEELSAIPRSWIARLSEWRGIYFILDTTDGRGYVGSAHGSENIYGRWRSYAQTGHGGNVELRKRDPKNFRFSILQRVSPDMNPEEIIQIENTWKERLHTREVGLNSN